MRCLNSAYGARARASARTLAAAWLSCTLLPACGSDPARPEEKAETPDAAQTLTFEVNANRRTYLDLSVPAVVEIAGDPDQSRAWDLALIGYDVLTNGGLSGAAGEGSAFGPLATSFFLFPDDPVGVPFLIEDRAGGAFLGWYAYQGASHTIYSRYHVYGVRSGERLFKLQILGYYGEVAGAPVSALYQVRYAEVLPTGVGETREIRDVNATLDGATPAPDVPNTCLSLASAETLALSPLEAADSLAWDVCFRREAISVNGELGGPGDVSAVDLSAADTADEVLADVVARSADSELARFDAVDAATLNAPGLEYRGDFASSAFTNKWVNLDDSPPTPRADTAFLVVGADGRSRFLITFETFEGATPDSPGTVTLFVQPAVSP